MWMLDPVKVTNDLVKPLDLAIIARGLGDTMSEHSMFTREF